MSRRVEKKLTQNETVTKHERFVYDNYKCIEKLDVLNGSVASQKYAWRGDELLCMSDANGTYAYFSDANKNIGQLINIATGTICSKYEYSPYGQLTSSDDALSNPFRFSSEYHDEETGLIYYNYRYYSPNLGRWLSRDPLEEQGGRNLYIACGNNLINIYDQYGLLSFHWYGNYGGPGWANGGKVNDGWYDPTKTYKDPVDALDACYKEHDKCYENCRNNNKCAKDQDSCMSNCDYASVPCQLSALKNSNLQWNGYLQAIPGALGLGGQGVVRDVASTTASAVGAIPGAVESGLNSTIKAAGTAVNATGNAVNATGNAIGNSVSSAWNLVF